MATVTKPKSVRILGRLLARRMVVFFVSVMALGVIFLGLRAVSNVGHVIRYAQRCSICGASRLVEARHIGWGDPFDGNNSKLTFWPPGIWIGQTVVEEVEPSADNVDVHQHRWRTGWSWAVLSAVPTGSVVLVAHGGCFGAFRIAEYFPASGDMEYEWWYRTDGMGVLGDSSAAIESGADRGYQISFGPFTIPWSRHSEDSDWLYYDHADFSAPLPDAERMCVTNLKSVRGLNARSEDWIFKASPTDTGIPGDQLFRND